MGNRTEVWWPEGRGFLRVMGAGFALLNLGSALFDLAGGEWPALNDMGGVLVGCLLVLAAARRRVETDDDGAEIVGVFKARYVPWQDVADIRPEKGLGSSRLVLVRRSGQVMRLPLNPTTHRALVARWREIAADRGTSTDG